MRLITICLTYLKQAVVSLADGRKKSGGISHLIDCVWNWAFSIWTQASSRPCTYFRLHPIILNKAFQNSLPPQAFHAALCRSPPSCNFLSSFTLKLLKQYAKESRQWILEQKQKCYDEKWISVLSAQRWDMWDFFFSSKGARCCYSNRSVSSAVVLVTCKNLFIFSEKCSLATAAHFI